MKAEFVEQLRCPVCRGDHTLRLCIEESDEREVREGLLRCAACASELRGAPRRARAAARPAGSCRRRGRGARALRRAHAPGGLGPRAGPAAARRRARLLVRAGALDAPAADDRAVPGRRERAGRRLEHVLGGQPLRRARAARDRARHRHDRAAGAVHGRVLHRRWPRVLRARARLDGRDPAGQLERRLRVLLRGAPPQRPGRPAAHVRRRSFACCARAGGC